MCTVLYITQVTFLYVARGLYTLNMFVIQTNKRSRWLRSLKKEDHNTIECSFSGGLQYLGGEVPSVGYGSSYRTAPSTGTRLWTQRTTGDMSGRRSAPPHGGDAGRSPAPGCPAGQEHSPSCHPESNSMSWFFINRSGLIKKNKNREKRWKEKYCADYRSKILHSNENSIFYPASSQPHSTAKD